MSLVDGLLKAYTQRLADRWDIYASGPERVWIAVYEPRDERRLRSQIAEFELATRSAGHHWIRHDLTDEFARWMATQEYREAYFNTPEDLDMALGTFAAHVATTVSNLLESSAADANTVVALSGIASLFGFTKASKLIEAVGSKVTGKLLLFFPGEHQSGNLRLLDARDGWNYRAVIIRA